MNNYMRFWKEKTLLQFIASIIWNTSESLKIPLGKYNDSSLVYEDPFTGQKQFTTSAPTVQPTNGSHDLFFYGFAMRDYKKLQFKGL